MEKVREMLTGNSSAAWGVRLAEVDYLPSYPITPQTEVIETLSKWINDGLMDATFVTLDSEHSMITAAGAASATGVRTFTATSSQGLLFGFEMLYTVAGWRVPLVMLNVSRGCRHPSPLSLTTTTSLPPEIPGFCRSTVKRARRALDSILMAYRLAEDERYSCPSSLI